MSKRRCGHVGEGLEGCTQRRKGEEGEGGSGDLSMCPLLTKAEPWLGPLFTSSSQLLLLLDFVIFFFLKHICEICSMLQITGLHWSVPGPGGHPQEED